MERKQKKTCFQDEGFEDSCLRPGIGNSMDYANMQERFDELLLFLASANFNPKDEMSTLENIMEAESELFTVFGFKIFLEKNKKRKSAYLRKQFFEKTVRKTLDRVLSYNQCSTEWTTVVRKKTRKKQYANPLLRLVLDYLH